MLEGININKLEKNWKKTLFCAFSLFPFSSFTYTTQEKGEKDE